MQDKVGGQERARAGRAGPADVGSFADGVIFEPAESMDALLEAHATIVAEIRARVLQPDLDGHEIAALAGALTALEGAIEIIGDGYSDARWGQEYRTGS